MYLTKLKRTLSAAACILLGLYMGCSKNDTPQPVDCTTSTLTVSITSTNPGACGAADGVIDATATSGGVAPYQFALGSQPLGSASKFTALAAGSYQVRVVDKNGCERTKSIDLASAVSTLKATAAITNGSCKSSTGSISITASGGVSPYSYSINGGAAAAITTFSALAGGAYTIVVKDNIGCQTTVTSQVLNGTTFSGEIKAIIDTKCAISGCHNGDNGAARNWTVFDNIKAKAAGIKSRTSDKSMPKTGSLTQAQIDLIACWVDDGALNN
jgi:hypothetical protein